VGAQVSGQLKRLTVDVGQVVEAGVLLAEIDPQLQLASLEVDVAQLAQLHAELEVQKLQAELASSKYERQLVMQGDGATRQEVVDQARSELRMATARVASIEAQIRQAQSKKKADEALLGYTRIYAPIGGTVVSVDTRPGQTLIAIQQVPLILRLADLSTMTVWAQVSEADIDKLHVGMDLYFTTLGNPTRQWRAKLKQILPAPPRLLAAAAAATTSSVSEAPTQNIVHYTALFDVDNESGALMPEMSAQVSFITGQVEDAVLVPLLALEDERTEGAERFATVSVVTAANTFEKRTVKLGVQSRFDAQVVSGLKGGERVLAATEADASSTPP
ncbi:MAG TPA: efflux RND transporter periplasmic adaptor subunit, partial [Polyangiales bacterium]|nr:efflux RND transporter periplasmic adaptor subunit [Polyangiales bacterium]